MKKVTFDDSPTPNSVPRFTMRGNCNIDLGLEFWVHNAFSSPTPLFNVMADYFTLFQLMLAALTFVIIGMGFIVYLMILGERGKKKLRAEKTAAATQTTPDTCLHFLGYLSEHPSDQPVPKECFGCMKANQCLNHQGAADSGNAEQEAEPDRQQTAPAYA